MAQNARDKPRAVDPADAERGGCLFGWGSAKGGGLPAVAGDAQGHCPFPTPLLPRLRFTRVSADLGNFCAVEARGGLFVWSSGQRRSAGPLPPAPTRVDLGAHGDAVDAAANELGVMVVTARGVVIEVRGGTVDSAGSAQCDVRSVNGLDPRLWRAVGVDSCGSGTLVLAQSASSDAEHRVRTMLFSRAPTSASKCALNTGLAPRPQRASSAPGPGRSSAPSCTPGSDGTFVPLLEDVRIFALGSCHGVAVVSHDAHADQHGTDRGGHGTSDCVYVWGANRSGCLGLGHRRDQVSPTPVPLRLEGDVNENVRIAHVAATRGQPHPKNTGFKDPAGQEGPRTHLVTSCGKLLIAGTCHKGLGLDHLGKVLTAQRDHLRFYCAGSSACVEEGKTAWGVCLTGALEGGLTPASVQAVQGAGGRSREEGGGGSNQGVRYLKDAHVTRSACASIHSFCIDSHGILRGWGCGSDGRLGLSNFFAPNGSKRLLKCYVSSPSPLDFARHRVVDVAVGRWWSFALVREHRERGEGETPGGGLDRESGLEKNVDGALTTDSATDSAEISASPGLPCP